MLYINGSRMTKMAKTLIRRKDGVVQKYNVKPKTSFKFTQLSNQAKMVAIKDYIKGWKETHDENITMKEANQYCLDSNEDVRYNQRGEMI